MSETFDFGDGPVPAHQHQNKLPGLEAPGGWVADTAFVSPEAYMSEDALVWGQAQVYEGVSIYGEARIFGSAQVRVKTVPDTARIGSSEDIRDGGSWQAFRTDRGIQLITYGLPHTNARMLSSWSELPAALHDLGAVSATEYLAMTLIESERSP